MGARFICSRTKVTTKVVDAPAESVALKRISSDRLAGKKRIEKGILLESQNAILGRFQHLQGDVSLDITDRQIQFDHIVAGHRKSDVTRSGASLTARTFTKPRPPRGERSVVSYYSNTSDPRNHPPVCIEEPFSNGRPMLGLGDQPKDRVILRIGNSKGIHTPTSSGVLTVAPCSKGAEFCGAIRD